MQKIFNNLSIAKKLVVAMVISSGLITIVTTLIELNVVYRDGVSGIERRLVEIGEVHVPDITERLWISDVDNIKGHLDSLVKFDGIHSVFMYENDKFLIKAGDVPDDELRAKIFNLKYKYKNEVVDIGRMDVYVTYNNVYDRIVNKVLGTLLTNGMKTFLVGFVVLYLFNFLITRHLSSMARYFKTFDILSPGGELKLGRPVNRVRYDELDVVVNAVNGMQNNIATSILQIDEKNRELESYNRRAGLLIELMDMPYANETDLIEYALKSAVELTSSNVGCINISDGNANPKKIYTYGVDDCSGSMADVSSLCYKCLEKGKAVVEEGTGDLCALDHKAGISSASQNKLCIPILSEDIIIGIVTVTGKNTPYTSEDTNELNLYVHSLWNLILRRRAQSDLVKSQQHYKTLVETSSAIPWIMDISSERYIHVGPQVVNVFGYSTDQWYQDRFLVEHVHPDDFPNINQKLKDSIATGDNYRAKYRIFTADGEERWVLDYGNIISEDSITFLQGFMFDITEQENQDLILRRSQKMEAMDTLAGGIAHDYNNMLGVIMGFSELMMSQVSDDPKLTKYSSVIHQAAQRGASLTSKLLQFSKQHNESYSVVSLNSLLREDEDLLSKTLTPKISLNYDLSSDLENIYIDKNGIEDAILNICINAMHAMPDGGKLIIRTENKRLTHAEGDFYQLGEGDYIKLSIIDNGIGMDKNTQEKVFDPFFSTKGDSGTGLGLSQVYGLVRRTNGAIYIDSESARGTTINILLPAYKGEERIASSVSDVNKTDGLIGGTESILVVDDESSICKMADAILSGYGYDVDTAEGGIAALEMLSRKKYHMVLSDVIMPGMNGYQLAHQIREYYPDVKIQLNSGYHDDSSRNNDDGYLYENILSKPYSTKDLLEKIRKLLDS